MLLLATCSVLLHILSHFLENENRAEHGLQGVLCLIRA